MNAEIIPFPQDAVIVKGRHTITTSLMVAEVFGKRHDNVLRAIRKLECSDEFRLLTFEERDCIDNRGKSQPMFEMTRDGWIMLVMGFTGSRAARFKETYISVFNAMERELSFQDTRRIGQRQRCLEKRNNKLKRAILSANTRLAKVYRYLVLGLNYTEIAKQLDCSRSTVRSEVRQLAECGMLEFANQRKTGQTIGKHYPESKALEA